MTDRSPLIKTFLSAEGWADAQIGPLAGDASNRRYLRLWNGPGGRGAVLMDAPPERGEDIRPFIEIARFLTDAGFSAPAIFAADETHGFLLLEDLGDNLFARHLRTQRSDEISLYSTAVDVLSALHQETPPALAAYDTPVMAPLAGLAAEWYANDITLRAPLQAEMADSLNALPAFKPVIILRDFHSENLLWMPSRSGLARVGLLDFQDAMLGHPVYDLVSLIHDARRDVAPETAEAMMALYSAQTDSDIDAIRQACAVQSAQRNLRILGVFARLCVRDGKPGYLEFIPRVWRLMMQDLSHPGLSGLRKTVQSVLPEPNAEVIEGLRAKCHSNPTP
ncbi:hypothetical protein ACMU_01650 [Actibacterium mucosum KCTC 23349]|uniref:Aminoglycoside phosphotransferase domain-containing protein n=1 Tax=Actibacterium mucosum KCTC 23349 TaxID=1454373 RepID=A0A037ZM91_9RHOB|nr:phosphotransferase [Actibacterium mucosum]KAJ57224.1 hypothetical protein ACMU_01650 [Actibacterium mucosum KCTC 23349]